MTSQVVKREGINQLATPVARSVASTPSECPMVQRGSGAVLVETGPTLAAVGTGVTMVVAATLAGMGVTGLTVVPWVIGCVCCAGWAWPGGDAGCTATLDAIVGAS